jgi:hypothetical protein
VHVRKRTLGLWIIGAVAFVVAVALAITWDSFHGWVDKTAPLAEWGVAVGTFGLAVATVTLARRAHQEAQAMTQQVALEREQLVAAQRPLVLPVMGGDDLGGTTPPEPHVELTNAGVGAAMNVRGFMWWSGDRSSSATLHPQVLAPGESAFARVLGLGFAVNWGNAVGYLLYHDLTGTEWQTHFRFREDGYGNVRAETLIVGLTSEFGEPKYNAKGWVSKPENVQLWQVAT